MIVLDALEELRRQYFVYKRSRTIADIAEDMGISRQVLARFGRDAYVSERVLKAIETWVAHQKARERTDA